MSIPVDLADLARTLEDYPVGYLLSTAGERVKAVTVEPTLADGALLVTGPGRGSLGNIRANAAVTLLFAPPEPRGYTLLVDGTAAVEDDDVRIVPAHAVLHRPADHASGPPAPAGGHTPGSTSACGHDCHPVTGA